MPEKANRIIGVGKRVWEHGTRSMWEALRLERKVDRNKRHTKGGNQSGKYLAALERNEAKARLRAQIAH